MRSVTIQFICICMCCLSLCANIFYDHFWIVYTYITRDFSSCSENPLLRTHIPLMPSYSRKFSWGTVFALQTSYKVNFACEQLVGNCPQLTIFLTLDTVRVICSYSHMWKRVRRQWQSTNWCDWVAWRQSTNGHDRVTWQCDCKNTRKVWLLNTYTYHFQWWGNIHLLDDVRLV